MKRMMGLTRENVGVLRTNVPLAEVRKVGALNGYAKQLEIGDIIFVFSDAGGDTDTMEMAWLCVVVNDERGVQTRDLVWATP